MFYIVNLPLNILYEIVGCYRRVYEHDFMRNIQRNLCCNVKRVEYWAYPYFPLPLIHTSLVQYSPIYDDWNLFCYRIRCNQD